MPKESKTESFKEQAKNYEKLAEKEGCIEARYTYAKAAEAWLETGNIKNATETYVKARNAAFKWAHSDASNSARHLRYAYELSSKIDVLEKLKNTSKIRKKLEGKKK
jgi:hypothetical protein